MSKLQFIKKYLFPDPTIDSQGMRVSFQKTDILDLMALARLRTTIAGVNNFTCGIINIKSGNCSEDCTFCSQSVYYNTSIVNYPLLSADEILRRVELKLQDGLDYLGLVASGSQLTDSDFTRLCRIAERITSQFPIKLCASIGFLQPERAKALKESGFTSYHHNLECSAGFFKHICTTHPYEKSLATVATAKSAGLRVCCGGLFGLGENFDDRWDLGEQLRSLNVDSIPVNFLIPIKGTPLEKQKTIRPEEALQIIAMLRFLNPDKDLVVCGGRIEALGSFKNMIFAAGANGLMLGDYLTRKGDSVEDDRRTMAILGVTKNA